MITELLTPKLYNLWLYQLAKICTLIISITYFCKIDPTKINAEDHPYIHENLNPLKISRYKVYPIFFCL